MQITYDENMFSDLFKEVNGIRPSSTHYFYEAPVEDKQEIWDNLIYELERAQEEIEQAEKASTEKFEALVSSYMENGLNRNAAIREVIMSKGYSMEEAAGFVCYSLGLSFDMEEEIFQAMSELY